MSTWPGMEQEKRTLRALLARNTLPAVHRLDLALRVGWLPVQLVWAFACDCAERALQQERQAGREPDARLWQGLETMRRFLRGEATKEELGGTRAAVLEAVTFSKRANAAADYAAYSVDRALDLLGEVPAWEAADCARKAVAFGTRGGPDAWIAAEAAEAEWQVRHLLQLLDEGEAP